MLQQGRSREQDPEGNGGHKLSDVAVYVLTPHDSKQ